jgi:hypothetical protein
MRMRLRLRMRMDDLSSTERIQQVGQGGAEPEGQVSMRRGTLQQQCEFVHKADGHVQFAIGGGAESDEAEPGNLHIIDHDHEQHEHQHPPQNQHPCSTTRVMERRSLEAVCRVLM